MSYGLCDEASGVRHKQRQLASKEYSAGVIAFYWCVSKRLDMLCHHNVFLSGGAWLFVACVRNARHACSLAATAPARCFDGLHESCCLCVLCSRCTVHHDCSCAACCCGTQGRVIRFADGLQQIGCAAVSACDLAQFRPQQCCSVEDQG